MSPKGKVLHFLAVFILLVTLLSLRNIYNITTKKIDVGNSLVPHVTKKTIVDGSLAPSVMMKRVIGNSLASPVTYVLFFRLFTE